MSGLIAMSFSDAILAGKFAPYYDAVNRALAERLAAA